MSPREWVEKDFYAVLGVPAGADQAEIKKAYKKLAKANHPDARPGDPKAEARFKEVSEAYSVVGDAQRRTEYDEARRLFGAGAGRFRRPGGAGAPTSTAGGSFDLGDLFGGVGSRVGGVGDLFGDLFRGGGRTRGERGADVETRATVDLLDAVRGTTLTVRLSGPGRCATCSGSGAAPGTAQTRCDVCDGNGLVSRNQGGFGFAEPCQRCAGSGTVVETPCRTCGGAGTTLEDRTLQVKVPAGIKDGQLLRLAGRGGPGERGGPSGDLLVRITVEAHPVFTRDGDDLRVTVPVTFVEAALGADVVVPTLDGTVTLRVPPGSSSGTTLRVRGRGVQRGQKKGDLLVTLEVAVPDAVPEAAVEALRAFEQAVPQDPRADLMQKAGRAPAPTAAGTAG